MNVAGLLALLEGCNPEAEVVIMDHSDIDAFDTDEGGPSSTLAAVSIGQHAVTGEFEVILFAGTDIE